MIKGLIFVEKSIAVNWTAVVIVAILVTIVTATFAWLSAKHSWDIGWTLAMSINITAILIIAADVLVKLLVVVYGKHLRLDLCAALAVIVVAITVALIYGNAALATVIWNKTASKRFNRKLFSTPQDEEMEAERKRAYYCTFITEISKAEPGNYIVDARGKLHKIAQT
ncbi:hypothetical protein IKG12_00295 [Candidatus Saccharibacteria bacterium]|nr:hypothetical protein [Candidatus Saccharibacteria bacterium]